MKKLFMFLLMAIMSARAMACDMCEYFGSDYVHTEVVNGIKWSYKIENGEAIIEDSYYYDYDDDYFDDYDHDDFYDYDYDYDYDFSWYDEYAFCLDYINDLKSYIFSGYSEHNPALRDYTGGNVIIPSILGGYPVTEIGIDAFIGCSRITSITIRV